MEIYIPVERGDLNIHENVEMWRCGVGIKKYENVEWKHGEMGMWRCGSMKMCRGEDVKMRGCGDIKM